MPCCIDRMRFSPRFSIRRKKKFTFLFFFSFFFYFAWDLYVAPVESGLRQWYSKFGLCDLKQNLKHLKWRGAVAAVCFAPRTEFVRLLGSRWDCKYGEAYLLGLLAKIKCSICSYQLNLWYVAHGVT